MLEHELKSLIEKTMEFKAEGQTLELKAAEKGCPKRLYDTLSSFSNQDGGGIILFGIDEENDYKPVGVYDVHALQKSVAEQCQQMDPQVRAVFTACEVEEGRQVVSAEIPGMDLADRPCYYAGKGRLKGSYVRVGDADLPMTEYEIYSFEAFRKKYEDDIRSVERSSVNTLNQGLLGAYLAKMKLGRPNLAALGDQQICELMSIERAGVPTLAGVMLFSLFPQAYFPQLSVVATVVPGTEPGAIGLSGERFSDNRRIEGTLFEQVDGAISFVRANMKTPTVVDPATGKREDPSEYPIESIRELILNAVIHRDYSIHTEGKPIQIQMFDDRIEITNPGGLYGRLTVDQLGKVQPDTRNPVIATAMEAMGYTENRYSGIPAVRRIAKERGMPEPEFVDSRGEFKVILRKGEASVDSGLSHGSLRGGFSQKRKALIEYCSEYRTRSEIAQFLGVQQPYAIREYVVPLVNEGVMEMEIPEKPSSSKQRYRSCR